MKTVFDLKQGSDHYEVRSDNETLQLLPQWHTSLAMESKSTTVWLCLGPDDTSCIIPTKRKHKKHIVAWIWCRRCGIELDPVHLHIAENIFKSSVGCELFNTDAHEWVQDEVSKSEVAVFDLIIDDLYHDIGTRGVPLNLGWYKKLAKLANTNCTIVFNITNPEERIPHLKPFLEDSLLHEQFPHSKVFRRNHSQNAIVAFGSVPFDKVTLDERLTEIFSDYPKCAVVADEYLISDIAELFS